MKRHSLVGLLVFPVILAVAALGHTAIIFSSQSEDSVSGTFRDNTKKKTYAEFSAKMEDDVITIVVGLSRKSVTLVKAPNKVSVASSSSEGAAETLLEDEKLIIDELATRLEKRFKNAKPLHTRLVCLLRHLASWPTGMPLSVSMDPSAITIEGESISREEIDEVRYQSILRNLEWTSGSESQPAVDDIVSLCSRIGRRAEACYPVSLKPLKAKCEWVPVGGTDCLGRCGGLCSSLCTGYRYTYDCLNHDRCGEVYGLLDKKCQFIFPFCFDDCDNAPECQHIPGVWSLERDLGCDNVATERLTLLIYPNHTLTTSTGHTGTWKMADKVVKMWFSQGWKPVYRGRISDHGLRMNGTIVNAPDPYCWNAVKLDLVLPK